MPFQNWPYSDLGNINLDWILARVKEAWEKAENAEEIAENLRTFVNDYFDNLDVQQEINEKIVEMLRPQGMQSPIELVFQSIEGLHEACPNHPGDWYFTGHYPTPGGTRLCNKAFVNYIDCKLKNNNK